MLAISGVPEVLNFYLKRIFPIQRTVLRSVRDVSRAEEIHQEVFLRVVQRASEFRGLVGFHNEVALLPDLAGRHIRQAVNHVHRRVHLYKELANGGIHTTSSTGSITVIPWLLRKPLFTRTV